MLIYSRREYTLKFDDPGVSFESMAWPSNLNAVIRLRPGFVFGDEPVPPGPLLGPSGGSINVTLNAYEGIVRGAGGSQLHRAAGGVPFRDGTLAITGSVLTLSCTVLGRDDLVAAMKAVWLLVQDLLPSFMQFPTWIADARGRVGPHSFAVLPEHEPARMRFVGPDVASDALRMATRASELPDGQVRERLVSALCYLAQVGRLRLAQTDRREFAGEILLNIAKSVEVLFGAKADDLRAQAAQLRFDLEKAEILVSVFYLRNTLDVAHPTMSRLTSAERHLVLALVDRAEPIIVEFMGAVVAAHEAGSLDIPDIAEKERAQRQQGRAKLFATLSQMLQPESGSALTPVSSGDGRD